MNEKGEAMYWKNVTDPATGKVSREKTTAYSDGSYYLCGTALPDVYGGFGTQLSYKGFDLSLAFSYQIGGQVYDGDYASYMSSPTSGGGRGNNLHADILKAWTPDNTGSSIPRYQWGDLNSTSTSDRFPYRRKLPEPQQHQLRLYTARQCCKETPAQEPPFLSGVRECMGMEQAPGS